MPDIPKTQSAVTVAENKTVKVTKVPTPKITKPDQVLIKVYAAAQNPTDGDSVQVGMVKEGRIIGNDLAGKVVEIGDNVKNVKVGDRVEPNPHKIIADDVGGGFAEYAIVPAGRVIHLPDDISMNEGATFTLAGLTGCMALFKILDLPNPAVAHGNQILIWGGSTSVGMYTIQLATLAGYEVITTASSKNESLLKSLGAKHVVDYSSSTVVEEINRFNNGTLKYAVDCISKGHSTPTAAKCLIDKGGQIANVLPVDQSDIGNNVQVHFFLLYQISGKEITYGPAYFPPSAEDKAWGEEWAAKFSKLICEHKVKPNPVKVLGGLDAVPGGLQYMREGKVHAQKLVYEVDHE